MCDVVLLGQTMVERDTITRCWAKGGGAEGKGPRWSKSKLDLKGKQKETSANVTTGDQSLSPLLTIYILHTDEDALISRDSPTPSSGTFHCGLWCIHAHVP